MTNPENPSSHDANMTDADRDHCVRYLLGELNVEQMAEFERQLASSSALGEELLQQSETICALSGMPAEVSCVPDTTPHVSRWPLATAVIAMAACLAWALVTLRPDQQQPMDLASVVDHAAIEELLIAKAWADSPLNVDSEPDALAHLDETVELDEGNVGPEDDSDIDSALAWMSIALAVELDLPTEGVADDG